MNKETLKDKIIEALEGQLITIQKAAGAAHSGATHEDAVAKGKYETHGLELSYIAGSQYERARHLAAELEAFRSKKLLSFHEDQPIDEGALVTLESQTGKSLVFLSNLGAGILIDKVKVLSPASPLGEEIMGSTVGDEVDLGGGRTYTIAFIE